MSVNIDPICPEGCSSLMPDFNFSDCAPNIIFGEIEKIYVASLDADPFTDYSDASEWVARIVNTNGTEESVREITVAADLPMPTYDEIEISNRRKVMSTKTFELAVTIDDNTEENYEAARWTQCNPTVRLWFADQTHLYGGNEGIRANVMLAEVIQRGSKAIKTIQGKFTWDAKFSPERIVNPLI